ncbi:MAG: polysaccharide deacetylase family protein [Salinivirgaceae bacterium]|nr:polysaccharide deacetylase family protein [Salinivirgaceae bacterium]
MLIYCQLITPRIDYIIDYIFNNRLGIDYELITDVKYFKNESGPKINYSKIVFKKCLQIIPEGLLSELDIRNTLPNYVRTNNQLLLFPDIETHSIGFDVFSACFWYLSRYEEYGDFEADTFDRFPASESFSFNKNILNQPIVDQWVYILRKEITTCFPAIELKKEKYTVKPTIDIDSPWCYKYKGFTRNLLGFLRDMIHANFEYVKLRYNVLTNKIGDPWYVFEWLTAVLNKLDINSVYFIHLGKYGRFDKTVNHKTDEIGNLLFLLKKNALIGLHPSFRAANNWAVFKKEIFRYEEISQKKLVRSRQHFLKFRLPEYYEMLESLEVASDYSMGFADKSGFRAGTSRWFYFYNLSQERKTTVKVHPFCIMDRTLKSYEKFDNEKVIQIFKEYSKSIKKVNGTFVSLWHNETFSDKFEWKGWKQLFEQIMTQIS